MKYNHTIYLDIDGTILDFTRHAMDWFHMKYDPAEYPKGVYELPTVLNLTHEQFWSAVDTPMFWSSIPPYEGAFEFVRGVATLGASRGYNVRYCSVGLNMGSYATSRADAMHRFNRKAKVNVPLILMSSAEDKGLLAKRGCIFIDDNEKVCEAIHSAGDGLYYLVPQPWNRRHAEAKADPDYAAILNWISNNTEGVR